MIDAHPWRHAGHYTYGAALYELHRAGGPDLRGQAMHALDQAQEFDPLLVPLLQLRIRLSNELSKEASNVQ